MEANLMVFICIVCFLCGILVGIAIIFILHWSNAKKSINLIRNITMDQISVLAYWPQYGQSAEEVAWIIEACFDVLLNREINANDYVLTKASVVLTAIIGTGDSATDISNVIREGRRIITEGIDNTKGIRIKL